MLSQRGMLSPKAGLLSFMERELEDSVSSVYNCSFDIPIASPSTVESFSPDQYQRF